MKRAYIVAITALAAITAVAAPIDEVRTIYKHGDYATVITKCKALLKKNANDGNANYYLGAAYYQLGNYAEAREPLKKAEKRGVADAPHLLAEMAFADYDFDTASEYIKSWQDILKRNRKDEPDDMGRLQSKIILAKNMLSRVEQIEFVDSVQVPAAEFFQYYVLPSSAGMLAEAASLPDGQEAATTVVYIPENGKEYLWSQADANGVHRIVAMDVIDDGTTQAPYVIGDDLGEGGNADYPFLCADGVTFYFANDGENSLGGYDIFMSRRDDEGGALQPQNIGMPYNSPYNDYMLAIDEENNLGWWASDRYCPEGMVTIYTFRPNDKRVNVSVDSPALTDYAMLKTIDIDPEGKALIAEIDEAESVPDVANPSFSIVIGGRTYHHLSDFSNPQAAQAMRQLLERQADLEKMESDLAVLRQRYGAGDTRVRDEILQLERRLLAAPPILERLTNSVITLELGK